MTSIIAERSDGIEVEHFHGFADLEVAKDLRPGQRGIHDMSGPRPGQRTATGPNAIIVNPRPGFEVYARYELWNGPPAADPAWDELWVGSLFLASGRVCGVSEIEGEVRYYPAFDLGREMTSWQARLCSKFLENDGEPGFPRHLYRINLLTLQFWLPEDGSPSV
ncbi:hypothetical protein [Streptosporangium carneum]|uniref:Uncharacterized protein n=1 Tax=Streptosporangium carneum TaxID=47481 RepID=A0A9W6I7Q1_9ACTN|nr:hypothetical protein [Streptosporangium carneum]GLK13252.1 hypothetical protein GCM10017600_66630 [Streptosporangium carneum]